MAALLGCGAGAMAQDIVNFSFEQAEPLQITGSAATGAGKPGNGAAMFFQEEAYGEIPASPALREAEKNGVLAVECWVLRDEDDVNGFILRQDGAFSLLIVPWDPSRVNLGIWNAGEYLSLNTEPCLKTGFWQHVLAVIDRADVKLYVDGKLQASATMAGPMQVSDQPVYFAGAYNEGAFIGGIEAALDEIRISDQLPSADYINRILARCTENFDATQQQLGLPPTIKAHKNQIEHAAAVQWQRTGETVTVENSFYRAEFSTASGLRLAKLVNKYGDVDCLTAAGSPLFSVAVDGGTVAPDQFRVADVEETELADGVALTFQLVDAERALEMLVKVECTSGRDIGLDYALTNRGSDRPIQLTAPLVENISIGPDFEENYYFWPMITGWVGKKSYELGMAYGNRCWIQMSDIFSPEHGVGLALSGRDTAGEVKGIVVRKTKKNGKIGVNYNINFLPMTPMATPFDASGAGSAMANVFLPQTLAKGAVRETPPAVLSVHPGDVLTPLLDYRDWVSTWFRHTPMPESIRDDYNIVAVHRKVGNRGFETGFGQTPGKIDLASKINPDGRDHQLQLAMWWQEHNPGEIASGEGDYEYAEVFGSRDGMIKGIREAEALGAKVSLYLCSRQAGNDSEVGQREELAYYPTPEARANDWGSFNPCTHAHAWQDLLISKYVRLAHDLPVAGLYLDTSAEVLLCANPGHPHAPNLIDDQIRLLTGVRDAIKGAKPEAYFFTEFMGSEFFGQYLDACWIQTFANPHAAAFNNYDLDFVRFVLPQVKYFEWGMSDTTFEVDSRRIFFNGVGGGRGDLTDEQNTRYADLTNTLREASRALNCERPEPFVAGGAERLYVNRFPGEELTAWTLYNKTGAAYQGAAFAVPADGKRYVELLHDTMPEVIDGMLQMQLPQDEVALVAAFDPVIEAVEESGNMVFRLGAGYTPEMELSVQTGARDSRETEQILTVKDGSASIAKSAISGERMIVKLKRGTDLVDQIVLPL